MMIFSGPKAIKAVRQIAINKVSLPLVVKDRFVFSHQVPNSWYLMRKLSPWITVSGFCSKVNFAIKKKPGPGTCIPGSRRSMEWNDWLSFVLGAACHPASQKESVESGVPAAYSRPRLGTSAGQKIALPPLWLLGSAGERLQCSLPRIPPLVVVRGKL